MRLLCEFMARLQRFSGPSIIPQNRLKQNKKLTHTNVWMRMSDMYQCAVDMQYAICHTYIHIYLYIYTCASSGREVAIEDWTWYVMYSYMRYICTCINIHIFIYSYMRVRGVNSHMKVAVTPRPGPPLFDTNSRFVSARVWEYVCACMCVHACTCMYVRSPTYHLALSHLEDLGAGSVCDTTHSCVWHDLFICATWF